jgi:hypothetical protein
LLNVACKPVTVPTLADKAVLQTTYTFVPAGRAVVAVQVIAPSETEPVLAPQGFAVWNAFVVEAQPKSVKLIVVPAETGASNIKRKSSSPDKSSLLYPIIATSPAASVVCAPTLLSFANTVNIVNAIIVANLFRLVQ